MGLTKNMLSDVNTLVSSHFQILLTLCLPVDSVSTQWRRLIMVVYSVNPWPDYGSSACRQSVKVVCKVLSLHKCRLITVSNPHSPESDYGSFHHRLAACLNRRVGVGMVSPHTLLRPVFQQWVITVRYWFNMGADYRSSDLRHHSPRTFPSL